MPAVTTESGRDARRQLVSLFEEAQRVARGERDRARHLQEAVDTAIAQAQETDAGDIRISPEAWQRLRACATP